MHYGSNKRSGFTLLEVAIVSVLFAVVAGAMMSVLSSAQDSSESSLDRAEAVERAKISVQRISTELEESGLSTVDCTFRYHAQAISATPPTPASPAPYPTSYRLSYNYDFSYSKYYQSQYGKQCTHYNSPWSKFHGVGAPRYPQAQIAERRMTYNYNGRTGEYLRRFGRTWPASHSRCPLDGAYLMNGSYVGAMKFFSPRDASQNHNFVTDEYSVGEAGQNLTKKADWQSIVFYMPYKAKNSEVVELRRYVVYKTDLFTKGPQHSYFRAEQKDWTDWDGNRVRSAPGSGLVSGLPTMIDLFDFGTDGSPDGKPDGKIPRSPDKSDAQFEYYLAYAYSSSYTNRSYAWIYWIKYYYDETTGNYRYTYLRIDRDSGDVYWTVYFGNDNFSSYWYRYARFTRKPEVISRRVVGVDFSTAQSNPYDLTKNPGGVKSKDTVRITIVLDRPNVRKGTRKFNESVQTIQVSPRNF